MAVTKARKVRVPRRKWATAEKRRIVELTLRPGTSVGAVAREQDVNPNTLYRWKRLDRVGKLDAHVRSPSRLTSADPGATFVPVRMVSAVRNAQPAARANGVALHGSGIVQLVLASGATLRLETEALDAALVCALVAELRR